MSDWMTPAQWAIWGIAFVAVMTFSIWNTLRRKREYGTTRRDEARRIKQEREGDTGSEGHEAVGTALTEPTFIVGALLVAGAGLVPLTSLRVEVWTTGLAFVGGTLVLIAWKPWSRR